MDDTDIRGLDTAGAREYLASFLTSLKQLETELGAVRAEAETWAKRVALAAAKGLADLQAQAGAKEAELRAKADTLDAERAELAAKVRAIRERLPMASANDRLVDTDQLLAEMQMATGELLNPGQAKTEEDLKSVGADAELEALKKRMSGS